MAPAVDRRLRAAVNGLRVRRRATARPREGIAERDAVQREALLGMVMVKLIVLVLAHQIMVGERLW